MDGRNTARPMLVAHRGYAGTYPENTVAAVEAAAADPRTDAIEIDVRACRGGEPVVYHDERLGRRDDGSPGLTDAEGLVRETPLETVAGAEVLGSGETVPRLSDVCDVLPSGTFLVVELKSPGSADVRPDRDLEGSELAERRQEWGPFVDRVVSILEALDLDVRLASFCQAAVAEAADRGYETAPICTAENVEASVRFAENHGCAGIHTDLRSLAGEFRGPDPSFDVVAAARTANLEVVGWTARTWHDAARMVAAGADGVTADYPSLLSSLDGG